MTHIYTHTLTQEKQSRDLLEFFLVFFQLSFNFSAGNFILFRRKFRTTHISHRIPSLSLFLSTTHNTRLLYLSRTFKHTREEEDEEEEGGRKEAEEEEKE